MKTPVRAAAAAAAILGAGLAGFGLTSALAQTDDEDPTTTTEAPAAEDEVARPDGAGCIGGGPNLDAMAEVIGIEAEELRTALEEGQTPAEVAEANGVSREDLVAAIVDEINTHLDEAVADGLLTEAQAEERRAEAEDHANDIVDGVRPEGGFRPGGPGGPPPFGAEDDAETEAEATDTATA